MTIQTWETQRGPHEFAPLKWYDRYGQNGRCRYCYLPKSAHPVTCYIPARAIGDDGRPMYPHGQPQIVEGKRMTDGNEPGFRPYDKVTYGVEEVRSYKIVREQSSQNAGSSESIGEFKRLDDAERVAKTLSDSEAGASWYTVPKPEQSSADD